SIQTTSVTITRIMGHPWPYPLALHPCRDVPAQCSSFRRPAGALIIPPSGFSERTLLFDKNGVAAEINRASGPAAMSDSF
ncbi:MAG: hypothetical protein KKH95_00480, partial [Gammaproteobacteria bacterium]|nr:hypothetical protein [Gammaproteobacteria bacterium]